MHEVSAGAPTQADGLRARVARGADIAPPWTFFIGSAVFHYLGPAFAVLLFARVDVLGVAWLRIVSAAIIFAAWRRPWQRWRWATARERAVVAAWGAVLAVMNAVFYLAIDRLPLGTVAALEFAGPILLALLAARTAFNVGAVVVASAGVYLLTDVRFAGEPIGFLFAFANAALFCAYIVLGHKASRQTTLGGIDGLASAMIVAGVVATPFGLADALPALTHPVVLSAGIGVGVSSSVIPYVCDQLAMRRIPRGTYSLLLSLLPATATVIGFVVLVQVPAARELLGIALITIGVAIHREPKPDSAEPDAAQPSVMSTTRP